MSDHVPADIWLEIASRLDPVELGNLAMTCRSGRTAAAAITGGCCLIGIPRVCNQGELCSLLSLSPEEARMLPHKVYHTRGSTYTYTTHEFTLTDCMLRLVGLVGGWAGLKERLHSREQLESRRQELSSRRLASSLARTERFDAWLQAERPFGSQISSVTDWVAAMVARRPSIGDDPFMRDSVLRAYFGSSKLSGPSVAAAKTAALAFAAREDEIASAEEQAEARKEQVVQALKRLGRETMPAHCEWVRKFSSTCGGGAWCWSAIGAVGLVLDVEAADRMARTIHASATRREEDARRLAEAAEARRAAEAREQEARQRAAAELKAGEPERRRRLKAELKRRGIKRSADAPLYDAYAKRGKTEHGLSDAVEVVDAMANAAVRRDMLASAISEVADADHHSTWTAADDVAFVYGSTPSTREALVVELQARREAREAAAAEDKQRREREAAVRLREKRTRAWIRKHCASSFRGMQLPIISEYIESGHVLGRPVDEETAEREILRCAHEADMLAHGRFEDGTLQRSDTGIWPEAVEKRRCTTPGCNNPHRRHHPALRATGPVCGGCERRAASTSASTSASLAAALAPATTSTSSGARQDNRSPTLYVQGGGGGASPTRPASPSLTFKLSHIPASPSLAFKLDASSNCG